jgi:N-formylglutamate amidohydrolase
MLRLIALVVPVAFVPAVGVRDDPPTGRTEDLVTIHKGTLPIILSAPHGGRKKVPGVPERLGKGIANFQTVLDDNTAEIAELVAARLEQHLHGKPWLVIARFERKYLDVNRPPEQAYESEQAKPYYDAYHEALAAACKAVHEKFGRGLLLDIHGQGQFPDAICRGTQNGKTVRVLKERYGWYALTGKRGLFGVLERGGYKILPACTADPSTKEEPLFVGGHIVGTYGSHTGYAIDAVQLEIGNRLREKGKAGYAKTAADLADALVTFHDEYLKDESDSSSRCLLREAVSEASQVAERFVYLGMAGQEAILRNRGGDLLQIADGVGLHFRQLSRLR